MLRSIACIALLASLACIATNVLGADEDPWDDKSRSDVVTLLGDPDKAKKRSDGSETLTYKYVRLEEGSLVPEGMTLMNVPGIGPVARVIRHSAVDDVNVNIGATETDERGRGIGGGVETEESYDITWNKGAEKPELSWEKRPSIRGKVTLKLEVGAAGAIDRWSVSPKKAATGG